MKSDFFLTRLSSQLFNDLLYLFRELSFLHRIAIAYIGVSDESFSFIDGGSHAVYLNLVIMPQTAYLGFLSPANILLNF